MAIAFSAPAGGALVLFSGGQDSTLCLAWALQRFAVVETVGFDYGQRHAVELDARVAVRAALTDRFPHWAPRLGEDWLLDIHAFGAIGDTALTSGRVIEMTKRGLPSTYVPGRNLVFLTYAAAIADRRGLGSIIGGMCETDYSGYPDCRRATLDAVETALNLGMERDFVILTPLMTKTKAQTWGMARAIGGDDLIDITIEHSHTCYLGVRDQRHEWGVGCGACPACLLRGEGWEQWIGLGRPAHTA